MIAAILIGAVCGAVSFLPLFFGLRLTRLANTTSNFSNMGVLLLGVVVSIALLFVAAIACIKLARDLAVPFVLAEGITLCVVAIVFGVIKLVRK